MALTDALPDMQREIRFFPVANDEPKHLSKAQVEQYKGISARCMSLHRRRPQRIGVISMR